MRNLTENQKHLIAIDVAIGFMSARVQQKILQKGYSLHIIALDYILRQKQATERIKNNIVKDYLPRGLNLYKSIENNGLQITDIQF